MIKQFFKKITCSEFSLWYDQSTERRYRFILVQKKVPAEIQQALSFFTLLFFYQLTAIF